MKPLLFALPLLVLVAAGCNSNQTQQTSNQSQGQPQNSQTQQQPNQNTSGTQMYTSAKYGFSFQYPSSWAKVVEMPASTSDYLPTSRTFVAIYLTYPGQDFSGRIDVYSTPLATVLKGDSYVKYETKQVNTDVSGTSWVHYTTSNGQDYFLEKNGKTYEVSGSADVTSQVLSTFTVSQ